MPRRVWTRRAPPPLSSFLRSRATTFPGRKLAELFGIETGPLAEELRRNILCIDGDDHRRLRNLVNPAFTPRAADRWRPAMRTYLRQLWRAVNDAHDAGTDPETMLVELALPKAFSSLGQHFDLDSPEARNDHRNNIISLWKRAKALSAGQP